MSGEDKAFTIFMCLVILAAFLFAGDPDVVDAIVYNLMEK